MSLRNLLFLLIFFCLSCTRGYIPKTGDLLFQDIDCGDLCDAIEKVTSGYEKRNFSHVGIVSVENDTTFVYEAIGPGVIKTHFKKFLDRSKDSTGKPKVIAGRIHRKFDYMIPAAIQFSKSKLSSKYDDVFDIENDMYYCSELVYFAFKNSSGNSLFELSPMTFKDPGTKKTFTAWEEYYKNLNSVIPEGKPGLNPGGISRSDKLAIVYKFY